MVTPTLFLFLLAAPPLGLDLYRPVPESNPLTKGNVALGRKLFFNKRLSRDGTMACVTCHDPKRAFADANLVAVGVDGRRGTRNAPTLVNRVYGKTFFLDGRAASLEEQALQPILNPLELDLTLPEIEQRTGMKPPDVARALASYVRTILAGESAYDKYVNGDEKALSQEALLGLSVFRGKGRCTTCHAGPTLSDEQFHNTGIAWPGGVLQDEGRFKMTSKEEDRGEFKTPTLREIARTAPYMHDGSLARLEDVIEYYDRGGNTNPGLDATLRPLDLTAEEKRGLIAFLMSLSGKTREGKL
jgi:cytochrome c peroxidase